MGRKLKNITVDDSSVSGIVRVHESVITAIVRKTAAGVKGVVRLAGSSLVNNIAEIVGNHSIQDRAISVDMNDDSVAVEVRVVLEYGIYIPSVAGELQNRIRKNIVGMTDMNVSKVNVVVMDIEDSSQEDTIL